MKYKVLQHRNIAKLFASTLMLLCVSAFPPCNISAQVRPVNDYGAMGLGQLLRRMNTTASVMMIGAHPDDEDSALLAYLARGENARTAYLSLTRGDGGQNIIGPELFEPLGIIRTEELLQARRLDGAEQYFTRAFDYGFSKTLAEAKQKWPEDVILCDAVRAIRTFRPLVVISRFSGTPADGHGQHQYAGYITPLAVKAAADPEQCKETGSPWQVLKFYVEQGFGDNLPPPTLKINTGAYDPILGRTYFEIAMEGRSQHRSQGEGRIEYHGDQFSGLNLVESKVARVEKEASLFDGIDTTISGITKLFPSDSQKGIDIDSALRQAQQSAEQASRDFQTGNPAKITPTLITAREALSRILGSRDARPSNEALVLVYSRYLLFTRAIAKTLGIQFDAFVDNEIIVPGGDLMVSAKTFQAGSEAVKLGDITLTAPNGWSVTKTDPPKQNNAAYNGREVATSGAVFNVKVDRSAKLTQPYWLENSREGDLFAWPKIDSQTLPFDPQQLVAHVKVNVAGTEITLDQPVQYRYADPSRGELRREVNVIPQLSINAGSKLLIVPQSDKPQQRQISMNITNNSADPVSGSASLSMGEAKDWPFTADSKDFTLKGKGEKTNVTFDVTIPAKTKPGTYNISASAMVGTSVFNQTMNTVAYPHIQTHRFYTKAATTVDVIDLKPVKGKIGYIMGSGDEVPEAIRQMGFDVAMLEEKDLASGDLSRFNTIVVGVRASETRPDLVANNGRLLDYVKNGGNVVVQYQRFAWTGLAPYPVEINDKQKTTAGSIARVVDENAKVTILQPDSPIFNLPNKITDADFAGWVQERNSYNLVTFDPQYTPLLESHDAGEQENKGGLVIAKVGTGNWIYCSYSMFRQLPAGVPGAYRLFANMLSVPRGK